MSEPKVELPPIEHQWKPRQYRANGQVRSSSNCEICGEWSGHTNHIRPETPELRIARLEQALAEANRTINTLVNRKF